MGKYKDLTEQKFGKLTVIKYYGTNKYYKALWECKCDCGKSDLIIIGSSLLNGRTTSCGCIQKKHSKNAQKKYNTYDLTGEYGIGYTFKSEEFYFDLEDYDKIKDYCWNIEQKTGYVGSYLRTDKKKTRIRMHMLIMDAKDCDHINHITYDNRKINLRFATRTEQERNRGRYKNNTSGHTGVNWIKSKNKWQAGIGIDYKWIKLGYFDNIEDAIKARKEAEEKYFGEYAYKEKNIAAAIHGNTFSDIEDELI